MGSRMEKYYREQDEKTRRSEKNQELYKNIYEDVEYSNIKDITRIEKTGEVDLQKIKEMLNRHHRATQVNEPEQPSEVVSEEKVEETDEELSYDVKRFISEAKSNRQKVDFRKRYLEKEYSESIKPKKIEKIEKNDSLMDTITNTRVLKELNNKELSEKLLSDLKGDGDTQVEVEEPPCEKTEQTFYSKNLKFKDDDFEDLKELNKSMQKSTKMISVLLAFLFIIMAGLIIYVIMRII